MGEHYELFMCPQQWHKGHRKCSVEASREGRDPGLHLVMGAMWVQGGRSTRAKNPHGRWPEGFFDNVQHDHHSDMSDEADYRNDTLSPEMLLKYKARRTATKESVSSVYSTHTIGPG